MDILVILLVGAVTLGLCFVTDKGFTALFRSKPQHKTGLSVRLSQHYGGAGIILLILGLMAVFSGWSASKLLVVCGTLVAVLGIGLVVYYMTFGIYYDSESLILTTFGRKSTVYTYADILGQKLYQVTGGSVIVELYFKDGRTVALQSNMKGVYPFLDTAFGGWCRQKGRNKEECTFYDPQNSCWFPNMEA